VVGGSSPSAGTSDFNALEPRSLRRQVVLPLRGNVWGNISQKIGARVTLKPMTKTISVTGR